MAPKWGTEICYTGYIGTGAIFVQGFGTQP